jgi:hypothetical protein
MVLREFRDKVLLKNYLGKKFVKFYYKHSPALADSISKSEALRFATRLALTPVVYSIEYPNVTLMLLLLSGLLVIILRSLHNHCLLQPFCRFMVFTVEKFSNQVNYPTHRAGHSAGGIHNVFIFNHRRNIRFCNVHAAIVSIYFLNLMRKSDAFVTRLLHFLIR